MMRLEDYQRYDCGCKFSFVSCKRMPSLKSATFDLNLNSLISSPNLIHPLFYMHSNFVGQKALVKVAKRSVASFKLREGMVIGTKTTVHRKSREFDSFYKNIKFSFAPSILRQAEKIKIGLTETGGVNFGLLDFTSVYSFFLLPAVFYTMNNLGGGNILLNHKGMTGCKELTGFFFSTKYIY